MIDTKNIASYADDKTPYSVRKKQCESETNRDKCHFLSSFDKSTKSLLSHCIL